MVTEGEHPGGAHVEEDAVHLMSVRKQVDLGRDQKKIGLSKAEFPLPLPPDSPYLPVPTTS